MNRNRGEIITKLRAIMPARAINLSEAFLLAEIQATELLKLLRITKAPVDIGRICDLPNIEVAVEPRHKIPRLAGFAARHPDGRWIIRVNENESHGERRQTLAHEFKHILDDPILDSAYKQLGFGDKAKHYEAIESICDHFAACALMPARILKKLWLRGTRQAEALAKFFGVSPEAAVLRVEYLGLTNGKPQPIKTYFHHPVGELSKDDQHLSLQTLLGGRTRVNEGREP